MRVSIKVALFSNVSSRFPPWGKILHTLVTSFPMWYSQYNQSGCLRRGRIPQRPGAPRCSTRPLRTHAFSWRLHPPPAGQLSGEAPALRKNKQTVSKINWQLGHRIYKTKRGLIIGNLASLILAARSYKIQALMASGKTIIIFITHCFQPHCLSFLQLPWHQSTYHLFSQNLIKGENCYVIFPNVYCVHFSFASVLIGSFI